METQTMRTRVSAPSHAASKQSLKKLRGSRYSSSMCVDINIATSKPGYFAGETVEGTVTVSVTDTDRTPADELLLELMGKTSSNVMKRTRTKILVSNWISSLVAFVNHKSSQSKDIMGDDLLLGRFGGRAEFGDHVFRFSFTLPHDLPSSMKETADDGSDCSIEYYLSGTLKRPGLLNIDATDKREIEVFARPKVFDSRPVLAGPDSTAVKTCCCFDSGSMTIGFQADSKAVGRNEVLGVTVVARNDSTKAVQELVVELCQEVQWTAHGITKTKKRTITSSRMSGSQLGDVGKPIQKESGRGRSLDVVSSVASSEHEQLLSCEAGMRHELVVPEDCWDTTDSEFIIVRHSIEARLKTSWCVTSPQVWGATVIQRAVGALPDGATQPMTIAAANPMNPYAFGVDAQGNPVPGLVI